MIQDPQRLEQLRQIAQLHLADEAQVQNRLRELRDNLAAAVSRVKQNPMGVKFHAQRKQWLVSIYLPSGSATKTDPNDECRYFGYYATKEQAEQVFVNAATRAERNALAAAEENI